MTDKCTRSEEEEGTLTMGSGLVLLAMDLVEHEAFSSDSSLTPIRLSPFLLECQ